MTTLGQVDEVIGSVAIEATRRLQTTENDRLEYTSWSSNEKKLFEMIVQECEARGFDPRSVRHAGGHAFPDIVFPEARVGVEVKCHKKAGEKLLGNSITGSTFSLSDPIAVRLLVWTNSTRTVHVHDYFESVIGAEVTHYPRFKLKPGAEASERLFGLAEHQIGSAKAICLGPEGIQYDLILAKMRAKELAAGNVPWWLGDDKPMALGDGGAIVRAHKIGRSAREEIETIGTFLFPEVMGSGSKKYEQVIGWAIATRGVLLTRDNFSAAGRMSVQISRLCKSHDFRVPKAFGLALGRLSTATEVRINEARLYWGAETLSLSECVSVFGARLSHVNLGTVIDAIEESACPRCKLDRKSIEQLLIAHILDGLSITVVDS